MRISKALLARTFGCSLMLLVSAVAYSGPETTTQGALQLWALRIPAAEKLVYRGLLNLDHAGVGNSAGMVYPAPNAAGAIAALITHGLILESAKSQQRNAQEEAANQVLQPYRAVLDGYGPEELMQRGREKMATEGDKYLLPPRTIPEPSAWVVESAPVFFLTQDQRALVLDNTVYIQAPNAPAESAQRQSVRVVSNPTLADDASEYWLKEGGERLKAESAALLASSLDIALAELKEPAASPALPYRTVRYREGGSEKMERAQIVRESCGRSLIRNLRGYLMQVPTIASAAGKNLSATPGDCLASAMD